ncbi:hypothetical protein BGX24_005317, partial [Mortierella sp. AD032]
LQNHALGAKRGNYTPSPCEKFSAKAIKIARTKVVCDDDEKPINYRPVNPNQDDEVLDEEDEELDLDNEDEVRHHNDEDDEAEECDDDIHRLLEENDHDLQEAIETLQKVHNRRTDILLALRKK